MPFITCSYNITRQNSNPGLIVSYLYNLRQITSPLCSSIVASKLEKYDMPQKITVWNRSGNKCVAKNHIRHPGSTIHRLAVITHYLICEDTESHSKVQFQFCHREALWSAMVTQPVSDRDRVKAQYSLSQSCLLSITLADFVGKFCWSCIQRTCRLWWHDIPIQGCTHHLDTAVTPLKLLQTLRPLPRALAGFCLPGASLLICAVSSFLSAIPFSPPPFPHFSLYSVYLTDLPKNFQKWTFLIEFLLVISFKSA